MRRVSEAIWRLPIDEARVLRHAAGIREYRNGDASAPFNGDALAHLYEELLDGLNYWDEWGGNRAVRRLVRTAARLVRRALLDRDSARLAGQTET